MRRTTLGTLGIALLIGVVGSTALAKTTETYGSYDETYGDDYQTGDIARITYVENGVTIERGHQDPSGASGEGAD